jgi:hypothetical protein
MGNSPKGGFWWQGRPEDDVRWRAVCSTFVDDATLLQGSSGHEK